ncbi:uncharacterized protein [Solanum lycopersicum]|uniref:uncharacterized protein n=1 Tax=Solanum lycopersicum TaxID=4081 RepID=UPI003747E063
MMQASDSVLLFVQKKQSWAVASSLALRNKDEHHLQNLKNFRARPVQSQESVTHRRSSAPACANCCRTHPVKCRDGHTYYFNYGQEGHFIRVGPKNMQGSGNLANRAQSSLVAQPKKAAPRGATSGIDGGVNHLDAITSRHDQENSLDVFISMIKVFTFDVYALLDVGSILSFVTPYVANKFEILPEKLL